ncbi:MAG: hypothetical protein RIT10_1504 [Bacteroidota bacterium]|jgi:hypothetical protein
MTREARTVFLVVLTLLFYAFYYLFFYQTFIFPFPLNESIVFGVSLQFAVWNWKTNRLLVGSSVLFALLNVTATQFFWSFFLKDTSLLELIESNYLVGINLIAFLPLLSWIYCYCKEVSNSTKLFLSGIAAFGLFSAHLFNLPILEILVFTGLFFLGVRSKGKGTNHYLWLLLAVLGTLKLITLLS